MVARKKQQRPQTTRRITMIQSHGAKQARVTMGTHQIWQKTQDPNKHVIMHGPMSASKHIHPKTGMIIYVFGDYHWKKHACRENPSHLDISFTQAIEIAARQHPDQILDVHLERKTFRHKMKTLDPTTVDYGQGFLFEDATIGLSKKGYLRMSHNNVALSNLHVHSDDVRDTLSSEATFLGGLVWFALKQAGNFYTPTPSWQEFERWLSYILKIMKDTHLYGPHHQFNAEKIFEETKINKQIVKLPASETKLLKLLGRWKQTYIQSVDYFNKHHAMEYLYEILAIYGQMKGDPAQFPSRIEQLKQLVNGLLEITNQLVHQSVLQDIYMLARLMKHSHRNNIVYVGDAHALKLREGLQELGFTQIYYHAHPQEFQCIDLTALHSWPLF